MPSTIKFCVKLDMTPTQADGKMIAANMKRANFKLHKRFRDGRESLEDDSLSNIGKWK